MTGPLSYLQQSTSGICPETGESSQHSLSLKILHPILRQGIPSHLFFFFCHIKILQEYFISAKRATRAASSTPI